MILRIKRMGSPDTTVFAACSKARHSKPSPIDGENGAIGFHQGKHGCAFPAR